MKKVELLAPAGNYEAFLGAIRAGADAVYIGGRRFGARAYAENFTEEQVCLAIRRAHLYGKKVYLTVNTLLREAELEELPSYLRPFYEEGLDGVIVQDVGALDLIRERFPALALHASTQMAVTGERGARFLRGQGIVRVVPARELSLEEIAKIKETGVEVEAFIHGSMCYSYSGQCLFSSMLGGRSGNRGRCAQPCRLPYEVLTMEGDGSGLQIRKPAWPLSMKDMCTLSILPELLELGIDSFKIEGRMKKAEYTAGVTAMYRKYIDLYYESREKTYTVEKEDLEKLRKLYIRSEIQEGYYHKHNGGEMVTPDKPGYAGADEAYLQEIRDTYLSGEKKLSLMGELVLKKGEPSALTVEIRRGAGDPDGGLLRIRHTGDTVQAAQNQPLTRESAEKQIRRTGSTAFAFEKLTVTMEDDCFLPLGALNDLRRETLEELETALLKPYRRSLPDAAPQGENIESTDIEDAGIKSAEHGTDIEGVPCFSVQIGRRNQFSALSRASCVDRLYLEADMPLPEASLAKLRAWKGQKAGRTLYLVLPYVIRARDAEYMEQLQRRLSAEDALWDGVLIRNLESLQFLREMGYTGRIQADSGLYAWNRRAKAFWQRQGVSVTAPLECNKADLSRLGLSGTELIVYGRIILVVSANCIWKTTYGCPSKESGKDSLFMRDRYSTLFPVRTVCRHCYNEIYNSVPLSLHEFGRSVMEAGPSGVRLVFTTEQPDEIEAVMTCFEDFTADPGRKREAGFPYTRGHYKRGAK